MSNIKITKQGIDFSNFMFAFLAIIIIMHKKFLTKEKCTFRFKFSYFMHVFVIVKLLINIYIKISVEISTNFV